MQWAEKAHADPCTQLRGRLLSGCLRIREGRRRRRRRRRRKELAMEVQVDVRACEGYLGPSACPTLPND